MYGNEYEDGKVLGQCGNMKALPRTMMMMPILLMRMRMNMAMGGAWAMTLYCCPSKGISTKPYRSVFDFQPNCLICVSDLGRLHGRR